LIEELNRKYEGREDELDLPGRQRRRRIWLSAIALFLALVFLFSVTGRWLTVFSGPTLQFLRESWELSSDPLVRDLKESVVQIQAERPADSPRGQIRGSGFNIDPGGLVVTNRHLVEGASLVRISFPGRGTFTAEEIWVSTAADLALVSVQGENFASVSLSSRSASPGEELLVIGNPLQFARIANSADIIGYRDNPAGAFPFLVVEASIYPGSSGSPLFNREGQVTGVVFATLRTPDDAHVLGLAVDVRELALFLEEVLP